MSNYELFVYKDAILAMDDASGEFVLSPRFRVRTGLWRLVVSANDSGGHDGDVYNMDGTYFGSGSLTAPAYAEVFDRDRDEYVTLDRLDVDGMMLGYVAQSELVPGTGYSVVKAGTNVTGGLQHLMQSGPSLGPETMVMTAEGEQPVEWLEAGVKLVTRDHGFQPLKAVRRYKAATSAPHSQPLIAFEAGAMDGVQPDFLVLATANNRVLHAHPMAELMFGDPEVLIKAQDWVAGDTLCSAHLATGLTLTQLVFEEPELVNVSGMWIETQGRGAGAGYAHDVSTRVCLSTKEAQMLLAPRRTAQVSQGMIA